MSTEHHHLVRIELSEIGPTQATVGYVEVGLKRQEWQQLKPKKRQALLQQHWFPSVIGPKQKFYIVDHHHMGLALQEEGITEAWGMVLKDLSWLTPTEFWRLMEFHRWVHPYDHNGTRLDYSALPRKLAGLIDDPYRSLAGEVRRAGGYAKDTEPYSEFLWADFLRTRIPAKQIEQNFSSAAGRATRLAQSWEARYLPGWSGRLNQGDTGS